MTKKCISKVKQAKTQALHCVENTAASFSNTLFLDENHFLKPIFALENTGKCKSKYTFTIILSIN